MNAVDPIHPSTRQSPYFAIGSMEYALREIQRIAKAGGSLTARQMIITLAQQGLDAAKEVR